MPQCAWPCAALKQCIQKCAFEGRLHSGACLFQAGQSPESVEFVRQ